MCVSFFCCCVRCCVLGCLFLLRALAYLRSCCDVLFVCVLCQSVYLFLVVMCSCFCFFVVCVFFCRFDFAPPFVMDCMCFGVDVYFVFLIVLVCLCGSLFNCL